MKTAISTYSYKKVLQSGEFTIFDVIDHIKKLGMDGVEILVTRDDLFVPGDKAETIKAMVDYARKIGLEVPMYTLGAMLYCDNQEEEIEYIYSNIDIAASCGIPLLRFDVAYKYKGNEITKTPASVIKVVAPAIRKIAEYAASKGVMICSENHGRLLQDSLRVETLISEVGHSNYGLLCDMGNFDSVDEDCATAVSRLLPSIIHVHAKDNFTRNGMMYNPGRGYNLSRGGNYRRGTIFGHGDVPTFRILSALNLYGYDGYVSIEFEGLEDNIMALEIGSENLKRMLKDIDGDNSNKEWKPN